MAIGIRRRNNEYSCYAIGPFKGYLPFIESTCIKLCLKVRIKIPIAPRPA
jgi:hypothetical protein